MWGVANWSITSSADLIQMNASLTEKEFRFPLGVSLTLKTVLKQLELGTEALAVNSNLVGDVADDCEKASDGGMC